MNPLDTPTSIVQDDVSLYVRLAAIGSLRPGGDE